MKSVSEIDYIVHEYYRQTGKIAEDSLDSWIEAVRFIQSLRKTRRARSSRTSRKKAVH